MQYILTTDEYDELISKRQLREREMEHRALEACKALAEVVARNEHGWKGCVINKTTNYCDDCPALNWCPYEDKRYGK